ncbi:hypothetical protein L5B71_06740 [Avibacterium sp. 21-586]|uniref:hypothetical protein n=1 Tax=Avibacterium sp. 21-586 TaxID=2911534 RepID=UPI002245D65E|nr:hypothetical protein [Avibacterium sp. 21-586]MCW9710555.1 hypothetical protein [Avibacterium sp. 21-586]
MSEIINQPNELIRKIVFLPRLQQMAILAFLVLCVPIYLMVNGFALLQEKAHIQDKIYLKGKEIMHQQNIIQRLENMTNQKLGDDIITKTAKINTFISHSNSEQLAILTSEWIYSSSPLIEIKLTTDYAIFSAFLKRLLSSDFELNLLSMKIEKIEQGEHSHSISAELSLQLKRENK